MSLDGVGMFDDPELGELLVAVPTTNAAGQSLSARPAKPEGLILNRDETAWQIINNGRVVRHVPTAMGIDQAAAFFAAIDGIRDRHELHRWLEEAPEWP